MLFTVIDAALKVRLPGLALLANRICVMPDPGIGPQPALLRLGRPSCSGPIVGKGRVWAPWLTTTALAPLASRLGTHQSHRRLRLAYTTGVRSSEQVAKVPRANSKAALGDFPKIRLFTQRRVRGEDQTLHFHIATGTGP